MNNITSATNLHAIKDNDALFKHLTKRTKLAWPTFALLLASIALLTISTSIYYLGLVSLGVSIFLNAVACYMAFTVGHDASHNALSSNKKLNDWCGRISTMLLSPVPFFRMFRYIHMQHHRFANDQHKDPDFYCGTGPTWTLPLRWASLDIHYFFIYLKPSVFAQRPKSERRELFLAVLFAIIVVGGMAMMGWILDYLLLFVLPTRIAIFFLAFAFDFLPHYPHKFEGPDHPYQSTLNRIGWEPILTPVLLYQNYHLVHHLYPTVPFYRYIKVWRAKEAFHQAQNPAQTSAFGLGPTAP